MMRYLASYGTAAVVASLHASRSIQAMLLPGVGSLSGTAADMFIQGTAVLMI